MDETNNENLNNDYDEVFESLHREANMHYKVKNEMREFLLKKYTNVRGVIEDKEFKPLTKEEQKHFITL